MERNVSLLLVGIFAVGRLRRERAGADPGSVKNFGRESTVQENHPIESSTDLVRRRIGYSSSRTHIGTRETYCSVDVLL